MISVVMATNKLQHSDPLLCRSSISCLYTQHVISGQLTDEPIILNYI